MKNHLHGLIKTAISPGALSDVQTVDLHLAGPVRRKARERTHRARELLDRFGGRRQSQVRLLVIPKDVLDDIVAFIPRIFVALIYAVALLAVVIWGASPVATKLAVAELPPISCESRSRRQND